VAQEVTQEVTQEVKGKVDPTLLWRNMRQAEERNNKCREPSHEPSTYA